MKHMSTDETLPKRIEQLQRNQRRRAVISFLVPVAVAILSVWVTSLYFKSKNVALQVGQQELKKQTEAMQKLLANMREQGLQHAQAEVPITAQVKVKAEAERIDIARFAFTLRILELQPGALDRIEKVDYAFNHPTFSRKNFSSNKKPFQISYTGWGCLTSVIVTFTLREPAEAPEKTGFNMCADLGW
jgi:pYEATS domain-containing protein involved in immunity